MRSRIPGVRQRDSADCGPACIASVCAYYGNPVPLATIRQLARTDSGGTSMLGMLNALGAMGYEARGLRGDMGQLGSLPMPFIAHLALENGMHHYVAVYAVSRKGFKIMDPARGRTERISADRFGSIWTGALIALVPGTSGTISAPGDSVFSRFRALLEPLWKPLVQALVSAILYTVLGLSFSVYLGKITDHVFLTHNTGLLNLMGTVMLAITFSMTFLSVIRNLIMLKTGQVIDNQLILSYYRHLFELPQRFFDSMGTGEIISRIGDAVKIRGFVNESAVGILVSILVLVFSFSAMMVIHPPMALMMLAAIPPYGLVYYLFNRKNRRIERKVMEHAASLEEHLVDSLGASSHIRQWNLKKQVVNRSELRLNRLLDTLYSSGTCAISAGTASDTMNRLFTILLLWGGTYFVIRGTMSAGDLITFYALMGYCSGPLSSLVGANKSYQNAMIAADRLFEIFDLDREQDPGKPVLDKDCFGTIDLSNVGFSYGARGEQIREVTLTIPKGKTTLLRGPSGSGKSTVARLVAHHYPPDSGTITINGMDTRGFHLESIRSLVGMVPQYISILSGTLLENLTPGIPDPDLKRLYGLMNLLDLQPVIESLPSGLATPIRKNGLHLSGGEWQRMALVRALYPAPPLLILDEPGSFLDKAALQCVYRLLLMLREQEQTILLITHDPLFMTLADQVYRMKSGCLSVDDSTALRQGIHQV